MNDKLLNEELNKISVEVVDLVFKRVPGKGSERNANISTIMTNLAISCAIPNMRPEYRLDFVSTFLIGFKDACKAYDERDKEEKENGRD